MFVEIVPCLRTHSFAPSELSHFPLATQGLRRGLYSVAASRLGSWELRGLRSLCAVDAALKGRCSTLLLLPGQAHRRVALLEGDGKGFRTATDEFGRKGLRKVYGLVGG